ncbi:pyridoxal-5'-phosphate-dependent enzyme [Paracoccidioides lutzii Pb01]|uniref:Pyridoxal-5'-phosphate-dependent enzyme n=1 Tax=Paracoccidioides lutzii (strain ATCC MYA-826 / Pb01) TaxID=502779 RepID=C1GX28_PARBA|nr:pyridoxal-5'-phosphate-dependent enzyme [Paracoccidioides lutzii Pb01]EEH41116.2 pyridoxal-5'-phosphate-dependent enzyme [Paracoccidioides lutzii Pb01]
MTDPANWNPLTASNVLSAHALIKPYVHETPLLTSRALNRIASTPQSPSALLGTPFEGQTPANPKINFFFKCENFQRIGAFKARGAFHALLRLLQVVGAEEVRRRGVVTHSSGSYAPPRQLVELIGCKTRNHAQALSLAASTLHIPAHIVMPSISTRSKIAGTRAHGARIVFSGPTSQEREAVVASIVRETGAFLIPPYNHPDVVLGQGTVAVEMARQVRELVGRDGRVSVHWADGDGSADANAANDAEPGTLDAVITPIGGGGLNAGVATYFSGCRGGARPLVFGAEPSFQGGDDCRRGLERGSRITSVKTLTVADGLRTPVGEVPWEVISDKGKVEGVYAVSERQIREAMRLVFERVKIVVEPSAVVGLAVCLFDEGFRRRVEEQCRVSGKRGWDVGVVLSGGNVGLESVGEMFGGSEGEGRQADGGI